MNIRFKDCAAWQDLGRLSSTIPTQLFSFQKLQLNTSHQMSVVEFVSVTSLLDFFFFNFILPRAALSLWKEECP